jgi:hypothetical protein
LAPRTFDIGGLPGRLGTLTVARNRKGLRFALAPVLQGVMLAKLAGEDRPSGIAGRVMGTLNGLRISLLRHVGATNFASARRRDAAYLPHTLTLMIVRSLP